MAVLLTGDIIGALYDGSAHNANLTQIEASFGDLGPFVISGLLPAIGSGLSVNVALGVASIGGRVSSVAGFTIAGLTPSTTNHLYMKQDGTGTANTSGTPPANSVKLGTCVTSGGAVTSVATNWASGRQQQVRTENLVMGSGAGNPRALNLNSWHATNNEGNECKGTLPAGSLPADVAYLDVGQTFTAAQGLKIADAGTATAVTPLTLQHRSSGSPAAGFGVTLQFQLDNPSNGLTTYGQIQELLTGGAAGNESGTLVFSTIYNGTLAEVFRIRAAGTTPSGGVGGQLQVKGDLLHAGTLLAFYNATPAAQPAGSADVLASLVTLGLRGASSNPPLNLGSGAITSGAITSTGHFSLQGGSTPGAAAGTNAGTSPPAPVIVGNDSRGEITFGTGTGAVAGGMVNVTFASAYDATPTVIITPVDNTLVDLQPSVGNLTTTGFTLFVKSTPTSSQPNTTWRFNYLIVR